MGLSIEQIMELQAKKRVKGLYEDRLRDLMVNSDEPGIDVTEKWPVDFSAKSATTLYQGFRNAADKLRIADQVDVLQREDHVFVLVKSRVAVALDPESNGHAEPTQDDTESTTVEA